MTKGKRLGMRVAVGALVLSAGAAWASVKKGEVVTVRAISARVQKAAKFLSKTVVEVSRGEALTLRDDEQGDWLHVTTHAGEEGYINRGVVFEEKVQLSSRPGGGSDDQSNTREMELAGRGFTPDVEKQYRGDHQDMDKAFKDVDLIEKLKSDQNAVVDFAQQGGVGGGS
jgi:uncharacterized protein YgiM (DUF1202 family)